MSSQRASANLGHPNWRITFRRSPHKHPPSHPLQYLVRILISAGEASGEMYGAGLIEALKRHNPSLEFFGAGGQRMRDAGCDTVIEARDLAVVGITEILSHLPKIYRLFHKLIAKRIAEAPTSPSLSTRPPSTGGWRAR